MNRRIFSIMVLLLVISSQVIDHYASSEFTGWLVTGALFIALIIMFLWSGKDSDWIIEKTIIRRFRR